MNSFAGQPISSEQLQQLQLYNQLAKAGLMSGSQLGSAALQIMQPQPTMQDIFAQMGMLGGGQGGGGYMDSTYGGNMQGGAMGMNGYGDNFAINVPDPIDPNKNRMSMGGVLGMLSRPGQGTVNRMLEAQQQGQDPYSALRTNRVASKLTDIYKPILDYLWRPRG